MNIWVRQHGKTLGPLSLEKVLSVYNAGKFAASAEISDDQVTWRPISALARLAKKATAASPAASAASAPAPAPVVQPAQPTYAAPVVPPVQPTYAAPVMMPGQPMMPMATPSMAGNVGNYCRTCGAPIQPTAVICMRCGANPKQGQAFCPHCGSQTHPSQVICLQCGSSLQGANGMVDVNMPAPSGFVNPLPVMDMALRQEMDDLYGAQKLWFILMFASSIVWGIFFGILLGGGSDFFAIPFWCALIFNVVADVLFIINFCKLHYRYWDYLGAPDGYTPGQMVGFLFIPFFNYYWIFKAFYGLAYRLRKYGFLFVSPGGALTFCILSCVYIVAILLGPIGCVVQIVLLWTIFWIMMSQFDRAFTKGK